MTDKLAETIVQAAAQALKAQLGEPEFFSPGNPKLSLWVEDDPETGPRMAAIDADVNMTEFAALVAGVIREAFKPAAYVIGWYNQPPILDDIAVFPYDTPGAAASDAARNPDGIEWRVFALHEVPEGEADE